jgi:hypothetical protein
MRKSEQARIAGAKIEAFFFVLTRWREKRTGA